jgi:hypothetical protein
LNFITLLYNFNFLNTYGTGVEASPLVLLPSVGLFYQLWMMDGDDYGAAGGMNKWQGKKEVLGGTLPQ